MAFKDPGYGEISVRGNSTETVITVQGTWVQVVIFDTDGESAVLVPSASDDHITIPFAEICQVLVSLSMCKAAGGGDDTFEFEVRKNNGATTFDNLSAIRVIDSGAPGKDIGSVSMNGIVSFDAGDTPELWVRNVSSTNNILIKDATMSMFRLS